MTAAFAAPLPQPLAWPTLRLPGGLSPTMARSLLLALLLHIWLVLLLGNAPGGTARPGEGVFGAINISLRGPETPGAAPPQPAPEPTGPAGAAVLPRWGGAVRPQAAAAGDETGAAKLGAWSAQPAPAVPALPLEGAARPLPIPELPAPRPLAPAPPGRVVEERVLPARATPSSTPLPTPALAPEPAVALPALPSSTTPLPTAALERSLDSALRQPLPALRPARPLDTAAPAPALRAPSLPATPMIGAAVPSAALPASAPALTAPALPALPAAPSAAVAPIAPAPPEPPVSRTFPTPVPPVPAAVAPLQRAEPLTPPLALPTQTSPVLAPLPASLSPVPSPAPSPVLSPVLSPAPAAPPQAASATPARTPDPTSDQATPFTPTSTPTSAPTPTLTPGLPDAGSRVGVDRATAPGAAAPAPPRLNLQLPRQRGGELSRGMAGGVLPVLPRPPEVDDKLAREIEKAGKTDCRKAHAGAGLLAVVPLAVDALRKDGGCKW